MATNTKDDRAILRDLVWKSKHRDFKATTGAGHRTILINRAGIGTCLEPLDSLKIDELVDELPATLRAEWRRPGWYRIAVDRGIPETWRTETAGKDGRWGFVERTADGWRVMVGHRASDSDPMVMGQIADQGDDRAAFDLACRSALSIISPATE